MEELNQETDRTTRKAAKPTRSKRLPGLSQEKRERESELRRKDLRRANINRREIK